MRNAWQFWFAVSFVFKVQCGSFLYCVAHYLIGRYVNCCIKSLYWLNIQC
ncbi:DUF3265 domain-containing protein [Vibrio parahaemolyticus]